MTTATTTAWSVPMALGGRRGRPADLTMRCMGCHSRLADVTNGCREGEVVIEIKCRKCGERRTEVVRPRS